MISVIIPTYQEEAHIGETIRKLWQLDHQGLIRQIIVVDGGSSDATLEKARVEGVEAVSSPRKGRAAQMNFGASLARERVLYFLHADTIPPENFTSDIQSAIDKGNTCGCFRLSFDHAHWFLKANCWFTRFDVDAFHYGDQSLFVQRDHFNQAGGFSEDHIIFEDYQVIRKLKESGSFHIIPKHVRTSARKYLENGVFKMQGIFYLMYFLYRLGFSQARLVRIYRSLIKQDKI